MQKFSKVLKYLSPFLLILLLVSPFLIYISKESYAALSVYATIETNPTVNSGDSADDMAIWIHPTDPSLSTIVGTDKPGNLEVYDLAGNVLQRIPIKTNNVDLRYNFPLAEDKIALVTGIDKTNRKIFTYKVNPNTRLLEDVSTPQPYLGGSPGSAMYVSPVTGKYYVFMNYDSVLNQYELFDNGSGQVAVNLVRTVTFGSFVNLTEGVVADDVLGKVYVSEEWVAIWELGAEPGDGDAKILVDKPIAQGGHFEPDVEGLAIYYKTDGTGYLFASSQGNGTYTVYTREGNHGYLGSFSIEEGVIDKVRGTDGIDLTNLPLGPSFPYGVFIAQDGQNYDGAILLNDNFKLVPFETISQVLGLTLDTSWDPRLVGSGQQPTPTLSPTPTPVGPSTTPAPTESPTPTLTPTLTPTSTPTPTPTSVPSVLIFNPTDDAYVNSKSPNKNYGNATALQVDATPSKSFYLKFNITGLAGRQIASAKLNLYNTNASIKGGDLMFVPNNLWTETSINWNNAPATSGSIISSLVNVSINNWYEFDATPLINGDGIVSVRVSSTSANGADYYSEESAVGFRPYLEIILAP